MTRQHQSSYPHANIEQKWQAFWQQHRTYEVDVDESRPKYYVLDMFPYPSGEGLHVGHPLGFIASDIIARYKRLEGYNVLHPMGFDAFGLPSEQYAIQTGQHPAHATARNIERYKEQLQKIGLSFDWSREIRTCDPHYYHWTQWTFIQMFHHFYHVEDQKAQPISALCSYFSRYGSHSHPAYSHDSHHFSADQWNAYSYDQQQRILLSYRLVYLDDAPVNWCEALGSVLANDEVQDGLSVRGGYPVTQRQIKHWKLRITAYCERLLSGLESLAWSPSLKNIQKNWIGRSVGLTIEFALTAGSGPHAKTLSVFTTRPDTIYGVTFLALAPNHPLVDDITTDAAKEEVQAFITHHATSSAITENKDSHKEMDGVFTGVYAQHPLTNTPIPIWVTQYVLMDYGTGAIMGVPADDPRDRRFAEQVRLPVIENHTLNTPLAGLPTDQALARIETVLKDHQTPYTKSVHYRIKDAIFARQRYWGEPIPVVYKNQLPHTLPETELPLCLPEISSYKPTQDGAPPLARAQNWHDAEGHPLDTTTMPGYAGSCAYFLRYMDPHNTSALASQTALAYWQNVDLYIGGAEHATGHLVYSRFWTMFLYDIGLTPSPEPFRKLINQGMILGCSQYVYRIKGTQTFVSYGLIHNYSTQRIPVSIRLVHHNILDIPAFRQWRQEFEHAEFILEDGQFVCEEVVEKMSKSLFNTVNPDDIIASHGADCLRLYEMFLGPVEQTKPWSTAKIEGVHRFLNRFWRLFHNEDRFDVVSNDDLDADETKLLHQTIYDVRRHTENHQFNVAISVLMSCTNELTKKQTRKKQLLLPLVILIAPYCPHFAEELYEKLGGKASLFAHGSAVLPSHSPEVLNTQQWTAPVAFNGKVKFSLSLDRHLTTEEIQQQLQQHPQWQKFSQNKTIKKWIIVPQKMINIVCF